jgi:hypothetical protein
MDDFFLWCVLFGGFWFLMGVFVGRLATYIGRRRADRKASEFIPLNRRRNFIP